MPRTTESHIHTYVYTNWEGICLNVSLADDQTSATVDCSSKRGKRFLLNYVSHLLSRKKIQLIEEFNFFSLRNGRIWRASNCDAGEEWKIMATEIN